MRKLLAFASLTALLFAGSGCMSIASRAFEEAQGVSSDFEQVPGTGGGSFARFAGVKIAPPRSELGGLVNPTFTSALTTQLRKQLTQGKDAPFHGGSPALTIEPQIQWFHKGGAIMPEKFAVVLYYLKGEGEDLGRVQVITKSEATRTGDDDLAESSAKELAKYFRKHGKAKK